MRFVDTSIFLYAISNVPSEAEKAEVAREILGSRDLSLSVQVVQEFYVQSTRSDRRDPLTQEQALGLIQSFMRFPIHDASMAVVLLAMATTEKFKVSYWDAAIIEAARVIKCEVVLSEDLDHGSDYGGVRVLNPFVV